MRVTIIPENGFVSVDSEGVEGVDLAFMDQSIHAVQWYETDGEVEYKDAKGRSTHNEIISDLTPYQPALDAWQVAKDEEARAIAEPVQPDPDAG